MATDKYYYVKPKAKTRLSYGRVQPAVLDEERNGHSPHWKTGGQIMDLAFVGVQHQRAKALPAARSVPLLWLKITLLLVLGLLFYVGGTALYQGASVLKGDTISLMQKGVSKLEAAQQAVAIKNLPEARNQLIAAENLFTTAQQDILSLGQTNLYMSGLANEHFQIIAGQKLIDAGLSLAQAGQLLIATAEPAMRYFSSAGQQNSGATQAQDFLPQVIQVLSASSPNLDKALAKVAKANTLLRSIEPAILGSSYETTLKVAQGKAGALYDAVAMVDTLSKQLPRMLGDPNPRSYLILNQNDTELRPTGGFMGSYVLVKLLHGKITDFFVDDTYRIDGQLAQSLTGEKVIPNANFDPDFPATAKYVADLYEQSGGGTPDGVIAINTQVMSAILGVIGSIELPDRKLVITADNFADVVYGEIKKAEKTSNPKEVLSELSPILLQRITSMSRDDLNRLTPLLTDQLAKKNIMLYSRNADLQGVISQLNLAGELHETLPKQDYLMVVRANMGAVKSSANIEDSIAQQVTVNSAGEITEHLTLTYAHTGTGSSPDGVNKDYVRIYLPKGTTVKNIIGYDVDEKVTTEPAHEKTFFGFYVTTDPGETKTVTLDYQLPFTLDLEKGESYSIYIQKQAGTINTTLTSTLTTPSTGLSAASIRELFRGRFIGDISL